MHKLAQDEDIAVAGPVLAQSPRLRESELVELAKTKGQAHLAAIAGRADLGEAVTDVLVRRGSPEVVRTVADNQSAKFSEGGFSALVKRAEGDEDLAQKVGAAAGHSAASVPRASGARHRGGAAAPARVRQARDPRRDPARARQDLQRIRQVGAGARLCGGDAHRRARCIRPTSSARPSSSNFAKDKKFEETVAALAVLCGVPIETADRLMAGDRPDPILILCKAAGYSWDTVRAIIMARPSAKGTSNQSLEDTFANFEQLSASTAQRVVRFWQVSPPGDRLTANSLLRLKIR